MRYPDCQREDRDCSICSLSNYNKDCHNNPVNQFAYLRTVAGLTQMALAAAAGINIRQIQKIEAGEIQVENITLKNAIALADALGVETKELLT